jgi:hypothetical protein
MRVLYLYLIIFCSINLRTMKGLRRNCRCHKKTAARTIKIHPQILRFPANFFLHFLLINVSFIEFPS